MKQDRFLLGILAGIGLLIVLSIVLFFIRREPQAYGLDDTPEGVVRNYVLAIQKEDFDRAYTYIYDEENKPNLAKFTQSFLLEGRYPANTSVQLGETSITGTKARVEVTIIYSSNDPFDRTWDENNSALLTQQNGEWRIVTMPYPYWGWDWYTEKSSP